MEGEDSAEILPADTSLEEAANPQLFGLLNSVILVSKWQLIQTPKSNLDPSILELKAQ